MFKYSIILCIATVFYASDADTEPKVTPSSTLPPITSTPQGSEPGQAHYQQSNEELIKGHLGRLVDDTIDRNRDGFVDSDELKDWMKIVHQKVVYDNVERQWKYYDPPVEGVLSWDEYHPQQAQLLSWEKYKNMTYPDEVKEQRSEDGLTIPEMMRRAERRWKVADTNADGSLSKEEFKDYLHPEDKPRFNDLLVEEATEDMDKDKNEEVSLEEFMEYMKRMSENEKDNPDWQQSQQSHFSHYLDNNKDGVLDKNEMRDWIVPPYDRTAAEAWRLVAAVDEDKDNKLTRDDIVENSEIFASLLPPEYWMEEDSTGTPKHDEF